MSNLWWEQLQRGRTSVAEQAVLQHRALRVACAAAPHGKVFAIAERLAVDQGREATRRQLETALQLKAVEPHR